MIKESIYFPKNSGAGNSVTSIYKKLGVKEGDEAVVLLSKNAAEYFHIDDNGLVISRALILFDEDEAEDIGAAVAKELIPWCGQNHPEPTLHGIHVRIFGYDHNTGNYKEIMKVDNYSQTNDIEKAVTEYYSKIRD